MPWIRVDSVELTEVTAPAGSAAVTVFGGLLPGDLVIAGIVTAPSLPAYTVTDNAPSGSTLYVASTVVISTNGLVSCAIYQGFLADTVPNLTITAIPGVPGTPHWALYATAYRHSGVIHDGARGGNNGIGSTLGNFPVTVGGPNGLVVAVGACVPNTFPINASFPLHDQATGFSDAVMSSRYADSLAWIDGSDATMLTTPSSEWVFGFSSWFTSAPVSHAHGQFLNSGGLGPFPARRKPERKVISDSTCLRATTLPHSHIRGLTHG